MRDWDISDRKGQYSSMKGTIGSVVTGDRKGRDEAELPVYTTACR